MDLYSEVKKLNERVTQGEMDLLEIREELRRIRGDKLSDQQLAAAIKPVEARVDQVEVDVAAALAGVEPVILNADQPSEEDVAVLEGDDAVDESEPAPHTLEYVNRSYGFHPTKDGGVVGKITDSRRPAAETHTPEKRKPGRPRKGG